MIIDVLIVGAGPAGAVAATVLARAGARVVLIDRARFPRPKLCGDSINPGTLGVLRRLGLSEAIERRGRRMDGMFVTGPNLAIEGRYPDGLHGFTIRREDFDASLVRAAVDAGVDFRERVTARSPLVDERSAAATVRGVRCALGGASESSLPARVTIAADGRHSALAFALGLAAHPRSPRRWAIGAYMEGVTDRAGSGETTAASGEMHIRRGHYIGVAPLPDGVTNVCLVQPSGAGDDRLREPAVALRNALAGDRVLRDRFEGAALVGRPVSLGPLAVDELEVPRPEGLLVAGDASGFVDPMTGDGLRFALRGGELAARAALRALEHGWTGVSESLAAARRTEFRSKWRFNRTLRALVASPLGVRAAETGAWLSPRMVQALIRRAGDCDLAMPGAAISVAGS